MPISLLDGIVIAVMLISAILAMIRGLVREVLSLASWAAAAAAAYYFFPILLPTAKQYIAEDIIAKAAVVGATFLIVLLIVSYVTMRISDFMLDSQIGALDRSLGFVFGAARGLLLMVIAFLFINWLVAPDRQPDWIATAKSKAMLDGLGERLVASLPEDIESKILDRLKNKVMPGDKAAEPSDQAPPDAAPESGYDNTDRQGLDQLIQGAPPAR